MSEYQYYEFQAIDRPLDAAVQRALRERTTRAEITAHSLVNTYQWGDFKGDPRRLMADWFDLFVYWANWGSRTLMLRLPRRFLDPAAVRPYRVPGVLEARSVGDRVILEVGRDGSEDLLDDYPDEEGISAPFAALRAELLGGDRRCLFLGWLLGVQDGLVDDETPEPPRPPGLARPSSPLSAFAGFFGLDPDLLAAAAEGDDGGPTALPEPSPEELDAFIARLPDAEKTALLRRAVLEGDPHLGVEIRRRWAADGGRAARRRRGPGARAGALGGGAGGGRTGTARGGGTAGARAPPRPARRAGGRDLARGRTPGRNATAERVRADGRAAQGP